MADLEHCSEGASWRSRNSGWHLVSEVPRTVFAAVADSSDCVGEIREDLVGRKMTAGGRGGAGLQKGEKALQ